MPLEVFLHNKKLRILSIALFAYLLTACSESGIETPPPIIDTGAFIDRPIVGLFYQSGSVSGYTNVWGEFEYERGQAVEFKIGNVTVGSLSTGKANVTPLDLGNRQQGINILRFLNAVDQDAVISNGILITMEMHRSLENGDIQINFDQASDRLDGDPSFLAIASILGPHTANQSIDLQPARQMLQNFAVNLDQGNLWHLLRKPIVAADVVSGSYLWSDTGPGQQYEFNTDFTGRITNAFTDPKTFAWNINTNSELELDFGGGAVQRYTLISGTFSDGVMFAQSDEDQDLIYDRLAAVYPVNCTTTNLLMNGDFENSFDGSWTLDVVGTIRTSAEAYSGNYVAYFLGSNSSAPNATLNPRIEQNVLLPSVASALYLTGYYRVSTEESTTDGIQADTLDLIRIQNNNHYPITRFSDEDDTQGVWNPFAFPVQYLSLGSPATIRIEAGGDYQFITTFELDLLSLEAETCR